MFWLQIDETKTKKQLKQENEKKEKIENQNDFCKFLGLVNNKTLKKTPMSQLKCEFPLNSICKVNNESDEEVRN